MDLSIYDLIEKSCLFIVNTLYHQTIYSTILFILIFGLAYLLRGKSPNWQLGLWLLILVRLLLPTDLSFSLSARKLVDEVPLIDQLNVSMEKVSNKFEINQQSYQNSELNRFDRTGDQKDKKIVYERNLTKDLNRSISWPIIVAIVWFLGSLISLIFFLNKICSINRVLNHSSLIQDKRITAFTDYWRQAFKIRRSVNIFSSNGFLSPFTVGLFRPKIFIPQSMIKGADKETINSIIAHEMVHIKHFDHVWIRLQIVLQIIYFFHPVVWYANRQITLARERICDWIVLGKRVIPPRVYGKGMINVLEFNLFGYRLVEPLPCFSNHKKIFEYRIRDILKEDTMKRQKVLFIFIAVCLLGLFLLPLSGSRTDSPVYWPTKGWRNASPESQGMDSNLIQDMLNMILEKDLNIYSVLVARNGYIVLDAYSYWHKANPTQNIYSCANSVTSALIGIAIDKGYIKGVNQPVLDFFKKHDAKNLDANKKALTLEHLLTMTTGLEWRESYHYNFSGLRQLLLSEDWVQFMIDLPMVEAPGTRFEYCSGASFLLSAILQEQTGMNALTFANKHLFGPLGISDVSWDSNPQGITMGYSDLYLHPHDMAKIGYLYLNNGVWEGKRIISSQWIKASTRKHIDIDPNQRIGYGYQWLIVSPGIYTAIGGTAGQFIMVVPEKNMVAVFTGFLVSGKPYIPLSLLTSYIIPAVKSPIPLPENPKAEKALKSVITQWQTTNPRELRKISKRAEESSQRPKLEEYVNNEYAFSVKYDAEILSHDAQITSIYRQLVYPWVFIRGGLRHISVFGVLVDDIPQGMALENTGNYVINRIKMTPQVTDPKIMRQELIKLSDGTDANYFEGNYRHYQSLEMLVVGVIAYKNNKIIGAVAFSMGEIPIEYLAGMAKSLRFKRQ